MIRTILLLLLLLNITVKSWSQVFTEINPNIQGINQGNVMWGDYDNDSDLDVFVFGGDGSLGSFTGLYRNDDGTFVQVYSETFTDLLIGDSDWGDFDNDGDLDIVISGSTDSSPAGGTTIIYQNTGSGFTEVFADEVNDFIGSAVAWGDYDNDGDLDLAIGGEEAADGSNNPRNIEIYENEGTGFRMIYQEVNTGINLGSVDWGDYNNDGDLDLLITGTTFGNSSFRTSSVIDNTADGFVKNTDIELIGVGSGSGEWGDYDQDGDLDILLTGNTYVNSTFGWQTLIYQNTDNKFQLVYENAIIGTEEGEAKWGDYDSDGDLDVLVIGRGSFDFSDLNAKVYENTGSGFTELEELATGVRIGSIAWGDYENDGDLDILLAGQDSESNTITRIYVNDESPDFASNTPPSAPDNLTEVVNSTSVSLSWDASTDTQTPQNGLTYNVHVRLDESDTVATSQSRTDGLRKIVKRGNAGSNKSLTLELEPGDYYWKVQAIDNSFQGSVFSSEETFHINFPPTITGSVTSLTTPEETALLLDLDDLVVEDSDNTYPDDFTLTVSEGENYSVSGNEITPDTDFTGTLSVSISVNDGTADSDVFQLSVEVSNVNDGPEITGVSSALSTPEETSLVISLDDLIVEDPDNDYPDDFTLTVATGENYSVSGNEITPDNDFIGTLAVSVSVNDGSEESDPFELSIEVQDVPEITGVTSSLSTPEETSLLITLNDLEVEDTDSDFPDDFTLTVSAGDNYSVSDNELTPDTDFNGTISVPVTVNDGTNESNVFQLSIEVSAVNDVPEITGTVSTFSTPEETALLITLDDLTVEDPDNDFPDDFTLTVLAGDNYSVSDNEITPDTDFTGTLSVELLVNDGTDDSEAFTIGVEVTGVLGINTDLLDQSFSIYPNPVINQLNIVQNDTDGPYQLKIYSADGALTFSSTSDIQDDNYSVDLSFMESGLYILKVINKSQTDIFRLIKD